VDLKFTDTVSGDVVIALRDNKGRTLETGPVEQFVSVHPRRIQQDASAYDRMYGSRQNRVDRLTLVKMSSEISGMDPASEQVLAITDMFVLPTGEGDKRRPWVFLSLIVAPQDEKAPVTPTTADEDDAFAESYQSSSENLDGKVSLHDSFRRDVCICIDMDRFVNFAGALRQEARLCNLNSFFEINRNSGYSTAVLGSPGSLYKADVALLPSQRGADACIIHFVFDTLSTLSPEQAKSCFTTPDSFSTNANFPLRSSWSDIQREMFLGAEKLSSGGRGAGAMQMTREGVVSIAHRIVSQNSLSSMDLAVNSSTSSNNLRMQVSFGVYVCLHVRDGAKAEFILLSFGDSCLPQATRAQAPTGSSRSGLPCTWTARTAPGAASRPRASTRCRCRRPSSRTTRATESHASDAPPSSCRPCATRRSSARWSRA
jgi:hypothetical protein